MNKKIVAIVAVAGVLVLAVGVAVWRPAPANGDVDTKIGKGALAQDGKVRPAERIKVRNQKPGSSKVTEERIRPDMRLDDGDESSLTAEMLAVYRALQEALDRDDRRRVFALVRQLQAMDEWPDGIPISVKKRALSALAWFGSSGIAEAVRFLEDSSQEVRDSAIETFEKQLADNWDCGDYALSDIIVALSKVVTDADALDSFYGQLDNMRPSVRATTVVKIYESGNASAKQVLDNNLESIFALEDTAVTTREGVAKIAETATAEEAADPEKKREYDEMYGPTNWDW